jgi:hypothetical protein
MTGTYNVIAFSEKILNNKAAPLGNLGKYNESLIYSTKAYRSYLKEIRFISLYENIRRSWVAFFTYLFVYERSKKLVKEYHL